MADDSRAVLEGIVFGDDANTTPTDRVRPSEQLRSMEPPRRRSFEGLLAGLTNAEVAEIHDEFFGREDAARLLAGDPARPILSAALQEAVEGGCDRDADAEGSRQRHDHCDYVAFSAVAHQ